MKEEPDLLQCRDTRRQPRFCGAEANATIIAWGSRVQLDESNPWDLVLLCGVGLWPGCVGINRREVMNERVVQERSSEPS